MSGRPGQNTQLHARLSSSFMGKDAWMTTQLKVAFIHKVRGSSICLAHFIHVISDMLSTGVRTTRQSQTSGRLVQEVNGCTVVVEMEKTLSKGETRRAHSG